MLSDVIGVDYVNFSPTTFVVNEVPQGPSLGSLSLGICIMPLSTRFRTFDITHHQFADDSWIYNGLPLNPQTSDVIPFTPGRRAQEGEDLRTV